MNTTDLPAERLAFSVPELAKALTVSTPTIYKAINSGDLLTFQVGNRRLVSRSAALAYIAALERRGTTKKDVTSALRARHPQAALA